jgi:hypothetical protein
MSTSLVVLWGSNRHTLKCGPMKTLMDIMAEVCAKEGIDPARHALW